jgi:hypothetical protein
MTELNIAVSVTPGNLADLTAFVAAADRTNEGKNAWRQHRDAIVSARANSQYRAGMGDYQPKPEAALPLYSHCRVSSSVHPGTANRGLGTITRWTGRERASRGWKACTGAALAEAHNVIKKPAARSARIAFAQVSSISRRYVRTCGHLPKLKRLHD